MNRNLLTFIFASVLAMAAALTACKPEFDDHSAFCALPADGWAYGDTVAFEVRKAAAPSHGRLALVVRHTDSYAYGNLWLEVSYPQRGTVRPDSVAAAADTLVRDTVNVVLADDYGRWLGRSSGVSHIVTDTLSAAYEYSDSLARVYVRHIMRCDRLPDLEQIGVIFIP